MKSELLKRVGIMAKEGGGFTAEQAKQAIDLACDIADKIEKHFKVINVSDRADEFATSMTVLNYTQAIFFAAYMPDISEQKIKQGLIGSSVIVAEVVGAIQQQVAEESN